jgi:hypothetical protein
MSAGSFYFFGAWGNLTPFCRASESTMAIACFRLFTFPRHAYLSLHPHISTSFFSAILQSFHPLSLLWDIYPLIHSCLAYLNFFKIYFAIFFASLSGIVFSSNVVMPGPGFLILPIMSDAVFTPFASRSFL